MHQQQRGHRRSTTTAATTATAATAPLQRHHVQLFRPANHALRVAANVLLDCDAADLCCEHESNELRILLYDGAAGGTGLSWEAYQRVTELVDTAVLLLTECECTNGCPACVLTCETGCYNDSVCKRSGLLLLAALQLRLVGGGSPSETLGTMPDEGQQQEQTQAQQTGNGQ